MTTHYLTSMRERLWVYMSVSASLRVPCLMRSRTTDSDTPDPHGQQEGWRNDPQLQSLHCSSSSSVWGCWHLHQVSNLSCRKYLKRSTYHAESTKQAVRIHHVFTSTPLNKTLNWNLPIIYISTTATTLATSHFHFHTLWFKNKSFSGTINYEFVSCLSAQYGAWINSLLTHHPFLY